MSKEKMNTREVAEYLNIHEKQVYALIKAGNIPCTRVTGKWLFLKSLIDDWLIKNSTENISGGPQKSKPHDVLLASGSNDPVLDILLSHRKQVHPEFYIFTSSIGSSEGLKLLNSGLTDIAWCHLHHPDNGELDLPSITDLLPEKKIVVVHLFYRELGFLISPGFSDNFDGFKDLTRPGLRFVNRQEGSGTRVLLDAALQGDGVSADEIAGYRNEVCTHVEVGLAILSGAADVGIATVAIARLFDLAFVSIIKESFNMIMYKDTFFQPNVQGFIESLNSGDFRAKVQPLGNYDFTQSGKIIYASE